MERGISINTSGLRDKQALTQITQSIVSILKSPGDQETIRHALTVLGEATSIKNVSITGNHIVGDRTINIPE